MSWRVLLAGSAIGVAACGGDKAATLTAHWEAPDTADVRMAATAKWCVGAGRIDLRASVGDTGLGVVFYPTDSAVIAALYPVRVPGDSVAHRPSAGVAVRWVGKAEVQGWWGDSGSVELTGGWRSGLSGQGSARLASVDPDADSAPLTFRFHRVPLVVDTLCDVRVLPVAVPVESLSAGTPAAPGLE